MGGPKNRPYKRSLRNLVLDKRYQLRFTLFMVVLTSLLMLVIGWRVHDRAGVATDVAANHIQGQVCPKVESLGSVGAVGTDPTDDSAADDSAADATDDAKRERPKVEVHLDNEPPSKSATGAAGAGSAGGAETGASAGAPNPDAEPSRNIEVVLEDPKRVADELQGSVPRDHIETIVQAYTCRLQLRADMAQLAQGRVLITWMLIGVGLILVIGLALYGLKMTHRVAGPMFKIGLYFQKMKANNLEKPYNLRKGDQLVHFYDQFKAAHEGVREMESADIERLREVLAAVEKHQLAEKSEELATLINQLRDLVKRKEDSLG